MRSAPGMAAADMRGGQSGQALVEFALTSVILMILLSGLLDISRAFHYNIGLEGAARAGARHGAFYRPTIGQTPYLDDTDIKQAVDQVLLGDGLPASTFVPSSSCLAPTDANTWVNPPYAAAAYPTAVNSPKLHICYDSQGARKSGTKASPPAPGDRTYTGTDLLVAVVAQYGLIGGLSAEYLATGASLLSIPLTAYQHFSVQG